MTWVLFRLLPSRQSNINTTCSMRIPQQTIEFDVATVDDDDDDEMQDENKWMNGYAGPKRLTKGSSNLKRP